MEINKTYNVKVSFHTGFNVERIVFVFFLKLSQSGISFSLTYGSLRPFGSMGIRLRPCLTTKKKENKIIIAWLYLCCFLYNILHLLFSNVNNVYMYECFLV